MKKSLFISSLFVCFTVTAGSGTLNIYDKQPDGQIPKTFYGVFFEDINYSADGGLYAELIQNRSFEYDLAQAIANLNPKFFRFPGGCIVHGRSINNAYRWEETFGPVKYRKQKYNRWGYYQSFGLGFFEYFQFCEDIGAEPLPCLPMGVTPEAILSTVISKRGNVQYIVPLDKMQEWVQSALDLIEFAKGSVDTKWGGLRASMGHPASFEIITCLLCSEITRVIFILKVKL